MAALGGFILLFGFLAFNAGFRGHISQPGDSEIISRAIMNALLGACGGGVGALVIHHAGTFGPTNAWSFLMTLNGALAGLVRVYLSPYFHSTDCNIRNCVSPCS